MKITLIRPPRLLKLYNKSLFPAAPLGLAFIASALEESGHEVTVIDAIAENSRQTAIFKENIVLNGLSNEEIISRIPVDTELVGLSCMFTQDWLNSRKLINEIGEAFPAASIIAGGEHITALPEFSLSQCPALKACIVGEGEDTVIELCNALMQKTDLASVQGIAYHNSEGTILKTERRKRIRELDDIKTPAWHLFPVEAYFEEGLFMAVGLKRSLPILTTRGCPYTCTFCSSPNMWGTRYFMRDTTKVVDEIEQLIKTYNVDGVELFDLTAVISANWIIEFAKELIKRDLKITWQLPAGTRSEAITEEVVHYMKLSGCTVLSYAPESGSEEILQLIKKKVSIPHMLKAVSYSNKEKLIVKVMFIIGLPHEKHKHIWQTMLFMVKCSWYGAYDMVVSPFYPYPGSALFNSIVAEGKIDLNTEAYYHKLLNAQNLFGIEFFNKNLSKYWLRFYFLLYILTFYSSNYLFRPVRFIRTAINISRKTPQTRGEHTVIALINQYSGLARKAIRFKSNTAVPASPSSAL